MSRPIQDNREAMSGSEIAVDIDQLLIDLIQETNKKLNNVSRCQKKKIIFKVPKNLAKFDEQAYAPLAWSIGPYHNLKGKEKLYFMKCVFENFNGDLNAYYNALINLEGRARSFYEEISMKNQDFIEMLLVDSCVLLWLLIFLPMIVAQNQKQQNNTVPLENQHKVRDVPDFLIHREIVPVENQLPFEVLEVVYNIACKGNQKEPLVVALSKNLRHFFPNKECPATETPVHLLHLLHKSLMPKKERDSNSIPDSSENQQEDAPSSGQNHQEAPDSSQNQQDAPGSSQNKQVKSGSSHNQRDAPSSSQDQEVAPNICQNQQGTPNINPISNEPFNRWRRAIEYYESGVHFEKRDVQEFEHSLLDVEFENGVLIIPELIIDEFTKEFFLNLMAFEREAPAELNIKQYVTAYVNFIAQLLSMPEDVTLLSEMKIIQHQLGCDGDVSKLFADLANFTIFDTNSFYAKWFGNQLEVYYTNCWNRWFTWLKHRHFDNPWVILALVVTMVLLFCGIAQAVFSVLSYVKQPNFKYRKH